MTNPLLKPGDPKFQSPRMEGADGKNRFAEDQENASSVPLPGDEPFQASAASEARPFLPSFENHQTPRLRLLVVLCVAGWVAAGIGALSLAGVFATGWICPLLGLGPAAAAWLMAYEDLKAIEAGAIGEQHLGAVTKVCYAGVASLLACATVIGLMIYYQLQFLPDLF